MTVYVNVPIETDPDALAQDAFDFLATKMPGWEPHDGQLDTWELVANARMAATLRDTASDVSTGIFRYFGTLVNVPPLDAIAATGLTDWTLSDSAGHTIPDGTNVAITDQYGNSQGFTVVGDQVIPVGSNTINGVPIVASQEGAAGNVGSTGGPVQLIDTIAWVASITLEQPTGNGQDAEDDATYLDRLVRNLRLLSPRVILPIDAAVFAQNTPGIWRALALDGYNPADSSSGNARMLTVAPIDENGNTVASSIHSSMLASLQATRESTFEFFAIDPTYTTIDVEWDVNAWPGVDHTSLATQINSAIAQFLNPATWGAPPFGDERQWINIPVVKVNDIIAAMRLYANGIMDLNSVTIRTGVNAYAAADINLPGAAPLPRAGVVTGTVH